MHGETILKKILPIKEIRTASLLRNKDLSAALNRVERATTIAGKVLEDGIQHNIKSIVQKDLIDAQEVLLQSLSNNEIEDHIREIAFDELDMIIGKVSGATSFKVINLLSEL